MAAPREDMMKYRTSPKPGMKRDDGLRTGASAPPKPFESGTHWTQNDYTSYPIRMARMDFNRPIVTPGHPGAIAAPTPPPAVPQPQSVVNPASVLPWNNRKAPPAPGPDTSSFSDRPAPVPAAQSGSVSPSVSDFEVQDQLKKMEMRRNMMRGHLDRMQSGLAGRLSPQEQEAERMRIVNGINDANQTIQSIRSGEAASRAGPTPAPEASGLVDLKRRALLEMQLRPQLAGQVASATNPEDLASAQAQLTKTYDRPVFDPYSEDEAAKRAARAEDVRKMRMARGEAATGRLREQLGTEKQMGNNARDIALGEQVNTLEAQRAMRARLGREASGTDAETRLAETDMRIREMDAQGRLRQAERGQKTQERTDNILGKAEDEDLIRQETDGYANTVSDVIDGFKALHGKGYGGGDQATANTRLNSAMTTFENLKVTNPKAAGVMAKDIMAELRAAGLDSQKQPFQDDRFNQLTRWFMSVNPLGLTAQAMARLTGTFVPMEDTNVVQKNVNEAQRSLMDQSRRYRSGR